MRSSAPTFAVCSSCGTVIASPPDSGYRQFGVAKPTREMHQGIHQRPCLLLAISVVVGPISEHTGRNTGLTRPMTFRTIVNSDPMHRSPWQLGAGPPLALRKNELAENATIGRFRNY